jgi:alpha-galactosidase
MSQITHVPEHRLWLLTGAESSYALHLGPDDQLRGLHWGPRLTGEQAASLLDLPGPERRAAADPLDGMLDLAAAGGLRYGYAGLQVRFADGTRDLELSFTDARTEEEEHDEHAELVLEFADNYYPLTVQTRFRLRRGSDVIERCLVLQHIGDPGTEPITVVRADSATWVLPQLDSYRLSQVHGQWAAETELRRTALAYGETVLTSRRGVTGHQSNPWVMLDDGAATEEHGGVYSAALAWSGSWQLTVQRLPSDRASISAGFGHTPIQWNLNPGERLETPVSAGLYTEGGFGAASRAWHDYVRSHVLPHPEELRPVLYNSWEATGFDLSLDGQRTLADRAAALGIELFVMDDGWFGARTHDAAGLGDWTANPDRFPKGLSPLIDHVHGLGMKFGLWVEPEMVNPDSDLYRAHPDWVIHRPHRRRTESRNQLVLNLARQDVSDWVHGTIDRLLGENAIDFLKWDMNRPLTEVGPLAPRAGDGDGGDDDDDGGDWYEDDQGGDDWLGNGRFSGDEQGDDRVWLDYVRNLYTVLDRLRADHPALRIESCSSGGGRLDLGILARTDQVWTSDNTDAPDRLYIQHGYSQLYPAQTMGAWVTDSPNPYTGRRVPLDFRFHVAMVGALGLGADLAEWDDEQSARAAQLVAAYKVVRPLIQQGIQYRLRSPQREDGATEELSAVQYAAQDGSETVVLAYLRSRRFNRRDPLVRLRSLDPQACYRDVETGRVHHGAVLLARGLPLGLPTGDYASTMIHLVRVDGCS